MKKKLIIIDAMAVAYKSYFAFMSRPLITSSGRPTSAVYGFVNQLIKVINEYKPDYIAVATDSKEKTFRHDLYSEYKSSRSEMPEDMIPQIGYIFDVIEAFNIPLFKQPGYEADDLIGSLLKIAELNDLESFAFTPDKDYIQLVTNTSKLIKPAKNNEPDEIIDKEKIISEYGFSPEYFLDYLALIGDQSDDIPGVKGIGPKTAQPLIQKYHTIENLYDSIDEVEKINIKTKLIDNKDNAILSKQLAKIITDIKLDFNLESLELTSPNFDKLIPLFEKLEFNSLLSKIQKTNSYSESNDKKVNLVNENIDDISVNYILVNDDESLLNLCKLIQNSEKFVFDTETDSLDTLNANLAGVSFSIKPYEAYFIPINPFDYNDNLFSKKNNDKISVDKFIKNFKPIFENPKIKKICQNAKYDISILNNYEIYTQGIYFDTMLASYLIDPNDKHNMDMLALKYLNHTTIPITTIIGDKKEPKLIFEADIELLKNYACEDADITYRLYEIFEKILIKDNLDKLANEIEFPLVKVLTDMERTGVNIDSSYLKKLSNELGILGENYTKDIYKLAKCEFNINSTKQLQKILFEDLNLYPSKKTKTGFSTDAQSLESLLGQHDIILHILNYRQVQKLKSTYVDALPLLINERTKRLHTTFNQTITATGRLSSNNPNLQNIPIRTDMGKEIRKAFIARNSEYKILSADYSQIELRIMASICEDPGLTSAFINNEDIHTSTASQVFMVDKSQVSQDMRRKAKEVNFGILYGIGAFGLSTRLGISQQQAKEIIETYFLKFNKVKDFIEKSIEFAKTNGYSETLYGRRRYLPNINSKNRAVRQFEERVATNMPIQGTAADLIKIAMINVHKLLSTNSYKSKMILQVHDELVFDIYLPELEELRPKIIYEMENAMTLNVPLKVESGVGDNWLDAH